MSEILNTPPSLVGFRPDKDDMQAITAITDRFPAVKNQTQAIKQALGISNLFMLNVLQPNRKLPAVFRMKKMPKMWKKGLDQFIQYIGNMAKAQHLVPMIQEMCRMYAKDGPIPDAIRLDVAAIAVVRSDGSIAGLVPSDDRFRPMLENLMSLSSDFAKGNAVPLMPDLANPKPQAKPVFN